MSEQEKDDALHFRRNESPEPPDGAGMGQRTSHAEGGTPMRARDTEPGLQATNDASRRTTTPGIAPRPPTVDDEVTDPGFRPESVREIAELRTLLLEDGLDELATAAKATLMMPERPDSDGARNARYAGEGAPARAAKVTMPTGEVLLEPEDEAPKSRPPQEVVGLMRDPVGPEESGPRVRSEGREVPSGSVDLGMAVEPPRAARRDMMTAPSGRKIEIEEKREFFARATTRLLLGLAAGALLLMLGFAYYRVFQELPVKGAASASSSVTVQTSVALPAPSVAVVYAVEPSVPVASAKPHGTGSAKSHLGPRASALTAPTIPPPSVKPAVSASTAQVAPTLAVPTSPNSQAAPITVPSGLKPF